MAREKNPAGPHLVGGAKRLKEFKEKNGGPWHQKGGPRKPGEESRVNRLFRNEIIRILKSDMELATAEYAARAAGVPYEGKRSKRLLHRIAMARIEEAMEPTSKSNPAGLRACEFIRDELDGPVPTEVRQHREEIRTVVLVDERTGGNIPEAEYVQGGYKALPEGGHEVEDAERADAELAPPPPGVPSGGEEEP